MVRLAQIFPGGGLHALSRPVVKREEPGHLPHSASPLLVVQGSFVGPPRLQCRVCMLTGCPWFGLNPKHGHGEEHWYCLLLNLHAPAVVGVLLRVSTDGIHVAFQSLALGSILFCHTDDYIENFFLLAERQGPFNKRTLVSSEVHFESWRQSLDFTGDGLHRNNPS